MQSHVCDSLHCFQLILYVSTTKKLSVASALKMIAWKIVKLVCLLSALALRHFISHWIALLIHLLTHSICDYYQVKLHKTTAMQSKLNKRHAAHSPKRVKQLYFSFAIQVCLLLSRSISISFSLCTRWISISNTK